MIFALREPATLLGLILGFLVGIALRTRVQAWLLQPRLALLPSRRAGRRPARRGVSGYLDPYGTVAAVISGVGWGPRPAARRSGRASPWSMLAAAVVVHVVLAAAGFAGFLAAGGGLHDLPFVPVGDILHGRGLDFVDTAGRLTLGFAVENLGCAVLALVPIPPLEAGVAVWSMPGVRRSGGRLAYHLLEEQWGVAVLLLLLLLPLAGELPALLLLVNAVGKAVLGVF